MKKQQLLPVWNGPGFKKPRLPRTLAWVAGVELLSERFADVPQFANLQVWFDNHPVEGDWMVTASQAASERMSQQVLTVWYSSRGEPHWYFMVYPVEAGRRSHVRDLLEEQAFPLVENWMKTARPETWFQSDRRLRCIWDRGAGQITITESTR